MIGRTVTRLRAGVESSSYSYGPGASGTEDWTKPSEVEFHGVGVAPTSSVVRYTGIGSPVVTGISLLFPGRVGLDITARDRFRVGAEVWLVDGEPEEYVSPFTGWVGGTLVKLKRTEHG